MPDQTLLTQFLQVYAFQPATAFWRAAEVEVLRRYLPETGLGLDLGCGDGKLIGILFGEKISKVKLIGIDRDADEIEQAARMGLYHRLHACDAAHIPEEAGSFDFIISNSVLEHIEHIEAVIAEIARLLKPGGTLIFTVPGPHFHDCLQGPIGIRASRADYLKTLDQRLTHLRYWGKEEWHDCLIKHGLKIIGHEEYLTPSEAQRWENISRITAGVLYRLTRRSQTPMQIQKRLGLRQAQNRFQLPRWFARGLASLLSVGVKRNNPAKLFGCILIKAERMKE